MMVPMGSFVSLSDPRRTWSLASADTAAVADVACGITERRQLARMLVGRGVVTGADARVFLDADLDELWEEPDAIAGMPEAADRVAAAVRSGERILVFGDFDVDGVTAAALTALGLRALGGSGAVIVPNRFTDGYGLTDASVDRIVAARRRQRIRTTGELATIVEEAAPGRGRRIHPATRTFQAIRMEVNRELEHLRRFLAQVPAWLKPGGRLVVISFHSLEDRLVKERLRELAKGCVCPPDMPQCGCGQKPQVRLLTKKAARPGESEVERNPRSRSARLRAAQKL